jgi:hypothetical protein
MRGASIRAPRCGKKPAFAAFVEEEAYADSAAAVGTTMARIVLVAVSVSAVAKINQRRRYAREEILQWTVRHSTQISPAGIVMIRVIPTRIKQQREVRCVEVVAICEINAEGRRDLDRVALGLIGVRGRRWSRRRAT